MHHALLLLVAMLQALLSLLLADILVLDDDKMMADMTNRNFKKGDVEAVLAWTIKVVAPLFFRLVLLMFVMAFLAWPYSYMKAAYGSAPGIGDDISYILRTYFQSLLRKAPRNKDVQRLLDQLVRVELWRSLFAELRTGKSWANVLHATKSFRERK